MLNLSNATKIPAIAASAERTATTILQKLVLPGFALSLFCLTLLNQLPFPIET